MLDALPSTALNTQAAAERFGSGRALLRKIGRALDNAAPGLAEQLGALRQSGRKLDHDDPRVRREAAAKLASQLFFQPLLAELRKTPFGEKLARGGRTEEVFGEQLDTRVADAIAFSDPGGLVTQLETAIDPRSAAASKTAQPEVSWRTALQAQELGA